MKVLIIAPYPPNQAPSQRFRFEQYLGHLEQNGFEFTFSPFLDTRTWGIFYQKGKLFTKALGILKGLLRRLAICFTLNRYAFILIHREACPVGPAFFEWLYARVFRKRIIFDFDDAIWLHDVSEANSSLGWLKNPSKTANIIGYSWAVTCGNDYLASYASKFCNNTHVIPTTIQTTYHHPAKTEKYAGKIIIGWTGSSTTIKHFETAIPWLKKICASFPEVKVVVISNVEPGGVGDLPFEFIRWKKETEISDLSVFDIGIMPLPDDDWSKGKCGFKALQYMALEIPTVLSPVGVNVTLVEHNISGFLAFDESEWVYYLSNLISKPQLRQTVGTEGRKRVEDHYSVKALLPKYLDIYRRAASKDQS